MAILSMTDRAVGTTAAFIAGAASAKIFHTLPFNQASLPMFVSRGLVSAGIFLLSTQIAQTYFNIRKPTSKELTLICAWPLSTVALGPIAKIAMNYLNKPISTAEISANLALSTAASFIALIAIS